MNMSNANLFRRYEHAHNLMAAGSMPGLLPPPPAAPQPVLRATLVEHVLVARRGNLRLVKAVNNA